VYKTIPNTLVLLALGLLLSGCLVSKPVLVKDQRNAGHRPLALVVDRHRPVILVPVKADYINALNNEKVQWKNYQTEAVVAAINNTARQLLSRQGYQVSPVPDSTLTHLAQTLFRSRLKPGATQAIQATCATDPRAVVLAHYLLVKIAGKGTWNANTGALTPNANTTLLRAIVLDCQTHLPVWRNEVFFRKVPIVPAKSKEKNPGNIVNAVHLLYTNQTGGKQ